MKKFKIKIISIMLIMFTLSNTSFIYMAQTLDELEKEIAQIKEDTETQIAEQEQIKAEQVDTEAEIADLKVEMDSISSSIATEQANITNKSYEIEVQKGKIEEIQAQIPEAKEETGQMLQALQKIENSNILLQMVASPSDLEGDNILRRMESVNTISEYAGGVIIELIAIERELQYEKTVLDKQLAELEQREVALETEKKNLSVKEEEFQALLASQSESINEIDDSLAKAAEDQLIMEDTLAYYQSYGCTGEDVVGSDCGGLGDDDGDGIINDEDSCPQEYGTKANGCPVPEVKTDTSNSSSSSNSSSNSGSSGSSSSSFIRPLSTGVVTCEYACYNGHVGIDLDYADYVPILASGAGVVTTARGGCSPFAAGVNTCNGGYGNYVMVTHYRSDGIYFSLYAHLAAINVSQGQTVAQGQQVGTLGDSGNSAGSHLHFELYKDTNGNGIPDDAKTNPRNYIGFPATGVFW